MGLKQVLLLGAGLESLPCRQTAEMERMSFYEVDTPAVLAEKEKRLREVGITTPRNVYRVGVDLAEDWEKTLLEMTPFATEQRTLTALLGVVYLSAAGGDGSAAETAGGHHLAGEQSAF